MQTILAAGLTAGAVAMLALALPAAWLGGLLFRARGGWEHFGFPGRVVDMLLFSALATLPWGLPALQAFGLAWATAVVVGVFLLFLGAASLAHGNSYDLGEWTEGTTTKPELPDRIFGRESPGMTDLERTALDVKGAGFLIALRALPAAVAAVVTAGVWLAPALALLPAAWLVSRIGADIRLGRIDVDRLKRRLRISQWSSEQGMKPGWEMLEVLTGMFVVGVSFVTAAAALGLLAVRAWGA